MPQSLNFAVKILVGGGEGWGVVSRKAYCRSDESYSLINMGVSLQSDNFIRKEVC
jgi:hypothetical protein